MNLEEMVFAVNYDDYNTILSSAELVITHIPLIHTFHSNILITDVQTQSDAELGTFSVHIFSECLSPGW